MIVLCLRSRLRGWNDPKGLLTDRSAALDVVAAHPHALEAVGGGISDVVGNVSFLAMHDACWSEFKVKVLHDELEFGEFENVRK